MTSPPLCLCAFIPIYILTLILNLFSLQPRKNANGPSQARVLSPPMKSSSSSSSSTSSYSSSSEKRSQRKLSQQLAQQQQQQQQMEGSVEDKQEKANRIIHEAIAKARQRGEKNIPRVMSPESFPSSSQHRGHRERERGGKSRPKEKVSKKARIVASSKPKQKAKIG